MIAGATERMSSSSPAKAETTQKDSVNGAVPSHLLHDVDGYTPSDADAFMGTRQQAYFRRLLTEWRRGILAESESTLASLQDGPMREPDLTDRASSETDWSIELRTRDRQRKLVAKIDSALRRLDDGEYGYCEVTGEPIALGRLMARPIATMTVEAQEAHERNERVSRDD
jgi:DnaK suppressor protein